MADMLSRARFDDEDGMVSEDEEVGVDFFKSARVTRTRSSPALNKFNEREYDGEWLQIGRFLKTMTTDTAWTREEANQIWKKAYRFFIRDGNIWKLPKKRGGVPLCVVARKDEQDALLTAYHESPWAGHCGTWATNVKDKLGFGRGSYLTHYGQTELHTVR